MRLPNYLLPLARIACLLALFLSFAPLFAQSATTGTVEGRVLNIATGRYISNARVTVVSRMPDPLSPVPPSDEELREMFHRLNNQLGIILAHAELLEVKAGDDASRARAAQVVTSTLAAMTTAKELRRRSELAGV